MSTLEIGDKASSAHRVVPVLTVAFLMGTDTDNVQHLQTLFFFNLN